MSFAKSSGKLATPLKRGMARVLMCLVMGTGLSQAQEPVPGFKSYTLRHAAPDDVAGRLRKLLADMESDAKILSDPQSNRVLVQGSASTQQLAAKILQTLDQASDADAEPPARSEEVKGYRVDGDLPAIVKWLQQRFPSATGSKILADSRTRQVIVVAPPAIQREVAQLLEAGQIPAKPAAPEGAPRVPAGNNLVHPLQNITWRDLEGELVRLWGDQLEVTKARNGEIVNVSIAEAGGARPIMQIDRRASEVSFTGTGRTIALWRTVVEAIDSPQTGEEVTQLVPVRNADPSLVVSTVSMLNTAAEQPDDQVTQAVPVNRSNRKRNAADLVSMLYQQTDAAQPAPARGAAPATMAQPATPQPGAAQPGAEAPAAEGAPGDTDGGLFGPVQIEIINDAIIIKGNRRDVEKVKRLIEDIERTVGETQPVVEVYHLEHVNADAATTLVTELYTEILSERTGQVSIRSLGEPNAILLIGREESVKVVKDLILKIDQPSPPASKFEVFRLKHVSSLTAESTIRSFFASSPGLTTTPRTALGARVQTVADFRTNSLIVQASPRDMEEVRRLITNIDVEESTSSAQLRVFKLKNSLAETLATVLQGAIAGQAAAGGQQQGGQGQQPQQQQQQGSSNANQNQLPSVSLEFMLIDQDGGKLLRSGILSDVQVTADTNTNSLIVRAPAKSMELIAALIEQLDRLPEMSSQVKVFTVVNGNATSLTTMLQQLFGQQVTAGQGTQNAFGGLFGLNQLQSTTAGGESSLVPLRFAVDQRTNSIIASGSESDLEVVETILLRLDENIDDRRLTVVRLRNTQAASVAQAVQQYLTNLQQQVSQQLLNNQSISAFESVDRQVFVIAENVTNSLIVSASPRYQEEILKVIQELDVRPPMVMVQVLIAELVLDNTYEFGTEFGLQDSLVFDRGKAVDSPPGSQNQSVPGFNFNASPLPAYPNVRSYQQESLAGQSLTNFALGRSSSALGYSGLVLSAASESVNLLLRALQDEGKLQILSRPQIMTMHNQAAYVQVGQDVARITGVQFNQLGTAQPTVEDRSTGLILRVLPLINDDGVIVMGIEAERSVQGDEAQGTPISVDVNGNQIRVPPINLTKATTTISARDGQTVVFAGLIQKENDLRLRRVPYLADVPVLGKLFEFESNFQRRSELLIVLTPHVVRDEEDAERIKFEESSRMSWCLADVVNVTGDWGLQGNHCAFCNTDTPVIYPDVDPTGSMTPTHAVPLNSHSSDAHDHSSRRTPNAIPLTDQDEIVGPPVPEVDSAAVAPIGNETAQRLRPTNVTYGPVMQVSPANYEVEAKRLPPPK